MFEWHIPHPKKNTWFVTIAVGSSAKTHHGRHPRLVQGAHLLNVLPSPKDEQQRASVTQSERDAAEG